jgi:mannose-6-phosphate isomerase class I
MPLYEDRNHAQNKIQFDPALASQIVIGFEPVIEKIVALAKEKANQTGKPVRLGFDGYFGIDWPAITAALRAEAFKAGLPFEMVSINTVYKSQEEIETYKKRFTDIGDPGFGWVNLDGKEEEIMQAGQVAALRGKLGLAQTNLVVFGPGAAVPSLVDGYDLVFYFDKTRQPILWDMWDGKLVPFGTDQPKKDYYWKEYYYSDYYLLDAQKSFLLPRMDYWVEAIGPATFKLMSRPVYDALVQTMLKYPIKQVTIFQPGPWGAYRYKDLFEVPGLECNAWNETAGPELSLLIDVGREEMVNFPVTNLLQHPVEFVGPYVAENFPRCFPLDVWLDDGYFPEPQPAERISMPIHNHPSTDYVRRHFNEVIGRYETYYIAEAYEGANTWMGYKDDADLDEWERLCRESNNIKPIENWKDFIANWPTNYGDLFLIPPGTTHGHGGNQMVLEMDTSAGIAATEYSFFAYDFARKSWDDETKTMTARPMKMHLDHAFDNDKYCRESYVAHHFLAKPIVQKWTKEYSVDQYTSDPRMPFHIERLHFEKRAEYSTNGKILHIATLTRGKKVTIRSKTTGGEAEIVQWQSCILPASFGDYEVINQGEGECEVVILRWKE